jgi:hypothetical protein
MAMSSRERYISVAVLVAASAFAIDRLFLTPYLERRKALTEEIANRDRSLGEAQQVLGRERQLRLIIRGMGGSLRADASAVEGQLLHLLHEWEQQAGVGGASFQRVHALEAHGFTHLKFNISATGSMPAIAMLVYRVETAPIPLRVDDLHVAPKRDAGDELQVQLVISTLGRTGAGGAPVEREPAPGVALLPAAGGTP